MLNGNGVQHDSISQVGDHWKTLNIDYSFASILAVILRRYSHDRWLF